MDQLEQTLQERANRAAIEKYGPLLDRLDAEMKIAVIGSFTAGAEWAVRELARAKRPD